MALKSCFIGDNGNNSVTDDRGKDEEEGSRTIESSRASGGASRDEAKMFGGKERSGSLCSPSNARSTLLKLISIAELEVDEDCE